MLTRARSAYGVVWSRETHLPHHWIIRAKRVSNCYIQKKKICACVRLILVLVGKKLCVCSTNLGFSATYYVPDTYVPGISRQKSIHTYVMFRPWKHTSYHSYIYQLSLVVATATVSLSRIKYINWGIWCGPRVVSVLWEGIVRKMPKRYFRH